MSVGYRAIFRLDSIEDAISVAEEHLRSWLRSKAHGRNASLSVADWTGSGVHHLGANSVLRVVHTYEEKSDERRHLYRLTESNRHGDFIVALYAASRPQAKSNTQTLVVEVDHKQSRPDHAIQSIAPPRIVRDLLSVTSVRDGQTKLTGSPTIIRHGDVHEVIGAIKDPDRTASVIVASSIGREFDHEWTQVIQSLTNYSVGVAAPFVVFYDAVEELNSLLPASHRVVAGQVRTYLPNVDLEDPGDSIRHKWLGPITLNRSLRDKKVGKPLQIRHAEVARRRFVEMSLPSDVQRTIDLLRRAETGVERKAAVRSRVTSAVPQPVHENRRSALVSGNGFNANEKNPVDLLLREWAESASGVVSKWLKVLHPTPSDIDKLDSMLEERTAEIEVFEEQLSEAADRENSAQSETISLRRRLEDIELDLAEAMESGRRAEREAATLRQRLAKDGRSGETYVETGDDLWIEPGSVEEVVTRLMPGKNQHIAIKHVIFTGDVDMAVEVDRRYHSGMYAPEFWRYVHVLFDYADAKMNGSFQGSVHMYLTDDRVAGEKCTPTRHAATESESVLSNTKWCAERVFPVPRDVDPSGLIRMDAHFKPTHRDTFAPRMHYFDDTASSGKIYIGYVGRHLTNKKT